MRIVVCIKQVPDSAQIRVHPVTNTIMRQGVPAIVNPYDLFALEEAPQLPYPAPEEPRPAARSAHPRAAGGPVPKPPPGPEPARGQTPHPASTAKAAA